MGNLFSLDAWMMVWHFKETFILGFLTTIGVSLSALLISLCLGIIFGLNACSYNLCHVSSMVNTNRDNTSCLYIIGGSDLISLTYSFVTGASTGGAYGPAYLVCGVLFFIFCYPLSKMASSWENNLKKRDRMTPTAK